MNRPPVTLLWAPRSPCNLSCKYCYFGTLEDEPSLLPILPGKLSHIGTHDAPLKKIIEFIAESPPGLIGRVFVAGGEPTVWTGCLPMITALKAIGSDVVLCTNGTSLRHSALTDSLLIAGVDAVSVSLDSSDPTYNDKWRLDRKGVGWQGVVEGLDVLRQRRDSLGSACKIGIYMVITALNVSHISTSARFAVEHGVDYFVVQPISLSTAHRDHGELSLSLEHISALAEELELLGRFDVKMRFPNRDYLNLVIKAISSDQSVFIEKCFGGRDLFFIEPDGSVWDCPSFHKIANTPPTRRTSICGSKAAEIFSESRRSACTDCVHFSVDCVNMWQMMSFDSFLCPPWPEAGQSS